MEILLKNVSYYDNISHCLLKNKFIYIKHGYIEIIEDMDKYLSFLSKQYRKCVEYIDCRNLLVFPGIVNAHLHPSKEIYQGINDFDCIKDVLDKVHKNNELETEKIQKISALYSVLNQIRKGVTGIGLFTSRPYPDYEAINLCNIRANIHYCQSNQWIGSGNQPKIDNIDNLLDNYIKVSSKLSNKLISFSPATASELSATKDLFLEFYKIAKNTSGKLFLHIHEGKEQVLSFQKYYGNSAIEYLNELKILDENLVLIHSSFLSEKDIEKLNNSECSLIHCPVSNSYVGASTMPIALLKNKNIALGTDAAMVNPLNNILFDAFFCLYHHGSDDLSYKINSEYIIKMLTKVGSYTLGFNKVGEIKEGNYADLIFIENSNIEVNNSISMLSILYNKLPKHVMIDGKFVIKDDDFINVDFMCVENEFLEIKKKIKGF